MVKDPRKHKHNKAKAGKTFEIVKGTWVFLYQEQKCSKCGIITGKRKLAKVQSPLRKALGPKAGKHAMRTIPKHDPKKGV